MRRGPAYARARAYPTQAVSLRTRRSHLLLELLERPPIRRQSPRRIVQGGRVRGWGGQPLAREDLRLRLWNSRRGDEPLPGQAAVLTDHQRGQGLEAVQETVGLDRLKELAEALPRDANQLT
jgi:hypothetical protein